MSQLLQAPKDVATENPVRVGIFASLAAAQRAVESLRAAGFLADQITVVSSDPAIEGLFPGVQHQRSAGAYAPLASVAGGTIGALLGALAVAAALSITGAVSVLAATGIASWTTGALVGGFIGAMLTRGMEKEVADFYDQEVQEGEILVAAEDHGPNAAQRLVTAERILAEAGTEPMSLPEG